MYSFAEIKQITKILLGRNYARNNLTVLPDDIFIVSYPKSGNTWVRFLLANLKFPDFDGSEVEKIIPDIYQNTDNELLDLKGPRLIKSHASFDPRYKKVIYIVRDPREIFCSYYHHKIKFKQLDSDTTYDDFLPSFLSGNGDDFGNWQQNLLSWIGGSKGSKNFLLLKYEDIHNDTAKCISQIATYCGIAFDETSIVRSVDKSSFSNMRKIENTVGKNWRVLKNTEQGLHFTRQGKTKSWENELSLELTGEISDAFKIGMEKVGYQ